MDEQTQLKDHLIEFLHLYEVEDNTICENDRYEFIKSMEKKKQMSTQISDNNKRIVENALFLYFE